MRMIFCKYFIYFFLALSFSGELFAQADSIPSSQWISVNKDSLRGELLENKTIHGDFEHSILAALMYYPALDNAHIVFKERKLATTMAARPKASSIFKKKKNRKYIILINSSQNKLKAPLLSDVPFEARVGVIGHELAHIVDYKRKSFIQIIGNGIAYVISNTFKRNLEHKIDKIAIKKGLGKGLHQFRLFVEEDANTTDQYRRFKDNIYLSSADIEKLVKSRNNLAIED